MLEEIKKSIFTGCDFISSKQDSNGSFLSLSSPDKSFSDSMVFPSLFSTTLILSSINSIDCPSLDKVKAKAAKFLINQKSSDWSFNYWDRNSSEFKDIPYPDDLDDTMCALSALYKYNPKIFNGEVLARIVSTLTAVEVEEGGPYRTWLVDKKAEVEWLDTDFVVNVNIAYFLSLIGIELPKQTAYIEDCISEHAVKSPYYPTDFPAFYFISRFYKGKLKEKLRGEILKRKPENALDYALSALSILNLGQDPNAVNGYIEGILKCHRSGKWDSYPFYTGVNPKRDRNYYAGCEALTTALCIEALNQFLTTKVVGKDVEVVDKLKQNLDRQIIGIVKKRYTQTGRCLQEIAIGVIDKIKENDTAYQITLTPMFFKLALGKYGVGISEDLLIKLGAANLYGWIAYTIYDDFLDEEGSIEMLSVANVALRELSDILDKVLGVDSGFSKYAKKVIDNVDSANSWEVVNARWNFENTIYLKDVKLPDFANYKFVINRSYGHALGPCAILFSLGFDENSKEFKSLEKFFRAYIVAKQLNDDAHDWQEDFMNGHITPVIVMLIKKLLSKNPNYMFLSKENMLDSLQEIFWYETILDVCDEILIHVSKATKALSEIQIIENKSYLENLLTGVETGARRGLKEQKQTVEFINVYS